MKYTSRFALGQSDVKHFAGPWEDRQRLDGRNVGGFIASRSITSSLTRRLLESLHRHPHELAPTITESPHVLRQVMIAAENHQAERTTLQQVLHDGIMPRLCPQRIEPDLSIGGDGVGCIEQLFILPGKNALDLTAGELSDAKAASGPPLPETAARRRCIRSEATPSRYRTTRTRSTAALFSEDATIADDVARTHLTVIATQESRGPHSPRCRSGDSRDRRGGR